jgi:hypothetical protein
MGASHFPNIGNRQEFLKPNKELDADSGWVLYVFEEPRWWVLKNRRAPAVVLA